MSTGLNQQSISGKLHSKCRSRAQSVQKIQLRKFLPAKKRKIRESSSRSQSPSKDKEAKTQATATMHTIWIEYSYKWQESKTNVREHYMVGFFKYLTGGYGGKMMPKNAVEQV